MCGIEGVGLELRPGNPELAERKLRI